MARTGRVYAPTLPRASLAQVRRAFWRALPALVAPVLLTGGLLIGVATPTELGALVVVYGAVLGFVYGDLTCRDVWRLAGQAAVMYAVLVFIIAMAFPFGWLVAINQVPAAVARVLLGITTDPRGILVLITAVLFVAGCVMETTAILIISVPVFFPLAQQLGIDPVHFGMIAIVNLLIGTTTPPFGISLFITMQIARVSFGAITRAIIPFLLPMLATLLLILFVPELVLFLPRLFR
jgi:tripartite ATP-independent transporter DctM subunit